MFPLFVILVVIVFFVLRSLKLSPSKGWRGEALVKSFLLNLPPNEYKIFHNVILATPDGSTQLDHVIISIYGVFVIETKNMKGWIFGAENQSQWTQVIYGDKFRFQNPLRQNYKHTLSLAKALNISHNQVFSVVAFVGDSTFKTPMPPNVTEGYDCVRYIKQHKQVVFSLEEVHLLVDLLQQKQLPPTAETERQHIEHVQNLAIKKTFGTRFGEPMVERITKEGANAGQAYLGSSGSPDCEKIVDSPGVSELGSEINDHGQYRDIPRQGKFNGRLIMVTLSLVLFVFGVFALAVVFDNSSRDSHELKIIAVETTWLQVTSADKVLYVGTLKPEQDIHLQSMMPFHLWLGNAGGITLEYDGKIIPAPGRSRQVLKDYLVGN